ncbi:MAG: pirin family protein, partial [Nitrospinota bacterium]
MQDLDYLDPFLLLDEFKSDRADDYIAGFPSHPHRGIETVTYMLAGIMHHEDNSGASGDLGAGGIQWMTAGRGIIHSEMPKQKNGLLWGFQLWVNLPASKKMSAPKYQNIESEIVPIVRRENGAVIKVIAGQVDNVRGPVTGIAADPDYLDVSLPPGGEFHHDVDSGHSVFLYLFEGSVELDGNVLSPGNLAVFNDEGEISVHTADKAGRFLMISGKPLNEPMARSGPFVMNSTQELKQAYEDYRSGKF